MKQKFSIGRGCECNCHGRAGELEFCGYCASSHRNIAYINRAKRQ